MADSPVEVAPAGFDVPVGQAVQEQLMADANKKRLEATRDVMSGKMLVVLDAMSQQFLMDAEHALKTMLAWATALAVRTNTPKERFQAGVDEMWESASTQISTQKDKVKAAILSGVRQLIVEKRRVEPAVVEQMKTLGVDPLPDDVAAYLAEQAKGDATPAAQPN